MGRAGKGIIYGKVTIWSEGSETLGDMRKELSATIKELGYPEQVEDVDEEEPESVLVSEEDVLREEEEMKEEVKEEVKEESPWMRAARKKRDG